MSSENLPASSMIKCLQLVFPYLNIVDMRHCMEVNHLWQVAVAKYERWEETTRYLKIYDPGCLNRVLDRPYTTLLDLTGLVFPNRQILNDDLLHYESPVRFWRDFNSKVANLFSLFCIKLTDCPAFVIESLPFTNPTLCYVNAANIHGPALNIGNFKRLRRLKFLSLTAYYNARNFMLIIEDGSSSLQRLDLDTLRLTGITEPLDIQMITIFQVLKYLTLGYCTNLPDEFGAILSTYLKQLKKLRLEKYRSETTSISTLFRIIANMPVMEQFEIVDFELTDDIEEAIATCTNLLGLLIVPCAHDVSPLNNCKILRGLIYLRKNLSRLAWIFPVDQRISTNDVVSFCNEIPHINQFEEFVVGDILDPPVLQKFNFKDLEIYLKQLFLSNCTMMLHTVSSLNPYTAKFVY